MAVVTAADIAHEHQAALASMTPAQWKAVERLMAARSMASWTEATAQARLELAFTREAGLRSAS